MSILRDIQFRTTDGKGGYIALDRFPDSCPACDQSIEPVFVDAFSNYTGSMDGFLQAVFRCPRHKCGRIFLAYYVGSRSMRSDLMELSQIGILTSVEGRSFDQIIRDMSERFTVIYLQAEIAEHNGLKEICGPGYRKALEFLIKDYLLRQCGGDAHKEAAVKKKKLGAAVKDIDDSNIQATAKRAAWLGNDETHYERKWTTKDLTHLKDLISLVVNWIENTEKTKKYVEEMPEEVTP
ncbi:MAG: hypothetical protein WEA04_02825 [Candidatus Andersenbacteria bacterium]